MLYDHNPPETELSECDYPLDAHTGAGPKQRSPQPEDVTVCFNCGSILIFDDQLVPQIITKEQLADFEANGGDLKMLHKAQEAVKEYNQTHKQ
jgi:hypothetical protein